MLKLLNYKEKREYNDIFFFLYSESKGPFCQFIFSSKIRQQDQFSSSILKENLVELRLFALKNINVLLNQQEAIRLKNTFVNLVNNFIIANPNRVLFFTILSKDKLNGYTRLIVEKYLNNQSQCYNYLVENISIYFILSHLHPKFDDLEAAIHNFILSNFGEPKLKA